MKYMVTSLHSIIPQILSNSISFYFIKKIDLIYIHLNYK